jgi:uracil-DNA glycosylase family 4
VARAKTRRFAEEEYWGKPVPSFGTSTAELLIVGLAPAAHGANRTGRMFTGDRSGEWLYETLHKYGFANQSASTHSGDGLELINARITAVAHCAPPQNKLTRDEIVACREFLQAEFRMCRSVRVIIALGRIAYMEVLRSYKSLIDGRPVAFAHGIRVPCTNGRIIIGSYHPSQQNTFTGRLTREMFHSIFRIASEELR